MNKIIKKFALVGLVIIISISTYTRVNAQTPADDPGIGGPGTSDSAPAGDGAPIVPFDGGMSLILAASGIGYATKKIKTGIFNLQN